MPKTDDDTAEIILEHLRAIRSRVDQISEMQEVQGRDLLSLRKEIHGFRGDILRFEEIATVMADDIKMIKRRLELVEA